MPTTPQRTPLGKGKKVPEKRPLDLGLLIALGVGVICGCIVLYFVGKSLPAKPREGVGSLLMNSIPLLTKPEHTFEAESDVESLSVSPDGTTVAVADRTGVALFDLRFGKKLRTLNTGGKGIGKVAYAPSGKTLAAGLLFGKTVFFFNPTNDAVDDAKLSDATADITAIAFSPDGKRVAIGSMDKNVRLYDVENIVEEEPGRVYDTTKANRKRLLKTVYLAVPVTALAYAPSGKTMTVIGAGKTFTLDTSTGKLSDGPETEGRDATAVSYSPDGKTLALCVGQQVVLFDTATKKPVGKLPAKAGYATLTTYGEPLHLAWSPDSKRLATAHTLGKALIWDIAKRDIATVLECGSEEVTDIAFTPDGKGVITGQHGGNISVWKLFRTAPI